jgi:hypothetical protein
MLGLVLGLYETATRFAWVDGTGSTMTLKLLPVSPY